MPRKPRPSSFVFFLWPLAALAAFSLLQFSRIDLYDRIQRDLLSSAPLTVSPVTVSRLGGWAAAASGRLAADGYNQFHAMGDVRRLRHERPMFLLTAAGVAAAMSLASVCCAVPLATLASRRTRWLPYSMPLRTRARTAAAAIAAAWPWTITLGAPAGALVWFVTFDRRGASRTLIDGLVPTPAQAAAIVLLWSTLAALAAAPFLRRVAAAALPPSSLSRSILCLRCRYALHGATSGRCPECGALFTDATHAPPPARACHAAVARGVLALLLTLAATIAIARAAHPTARGWIALHPTPRVMPATGTIVSGDPPLQIRCAYGQITLRGEHLPPAPGASHGAWTIHWHFTPARPHQLAEASGTLHISDRLTPSGRAAYTYQTFPFGELGFYTIPTKARYLGVLGP